MLAGILKNIFERTLPTTAGLFCIAKMRLKKFTDKEIRLSLCKVNLMKQKPEIKQRGLMDGWMERMNFRIILSLLAFLQDFLS